MVAEENGGRFHETLRTLRGEEMASAALGAYGFYHGMARQVVFQAVGYVFALWHDADIAGGVFQNFVK